MSARLPLTVICFVLLGSVAGVPYKPYSSISTDNNNGPSYPTGCNKKLCKPALCAVPYTPPSGCCALCPPEKNNPLGPGPPKPPPTKLVKGTRCGSTYCTPVKCKNAYTPIGECCPKCPHVAPSDDACVYKGRLCQHGDTFNDDCNACRCWNGSVSCTTNVCDPCDNKKCQPVRCRNAYTPAGECCAVCPQQYKQTCKTPSGQILKHGDTVKVECNMCTCLKGNLACTKKMCPVDPCAGVYCPPLNCADAYVPMGECCAVCPANKNCKAPNGKIVKHGDTLKIDCNTCTCFNGDLTCEKKACYPDPCATKVCSKVICPDSYIPAGECCPVCPPPNSCKTPSGKVVKHGETFNVDCNKCICLNGVAKCTEKVCAPKNCKGPYGQVIKHGDTFKKDCNTCTCWNGVVSCTEKACGACDFKLCPPVKCSDSYVPPGECCPVCPPPKTCKGPQGQIMKHGDSYKVDCNLCLCWNGVITCTDKICDPCANKVCPPVKCSDSYVPTGECCPVCPTPKDCKLPNGQLIKHGDTFKVDCNTCTCWNGAITCSDKKCGACDYKLCPPVKCSDSYVPTGECCPVCPTPKDCKLPNGQVIKHGDTFKKDCNTCTCWNGAITCSDKKCGACDYKLCPPVKCSDSYVPQGECCPVCPPPKTCKGPQGQIMKHGDSYKVDCNLCLCWNGVITCTDKICDPCANKVCPPVKCSDSYVPTGECCPVCPTPKDCKLPNGQLIKHGDTFKVDCNTCTCWNGAITCSDKKCGACDYKLCPPVKCSDSYVPTGECCPVCPSPKDCKLPNGQVIKHGDTFKKDCNTCTCWNGAITCSDKKCGACDYKLCPPVKCSDSYVPPGECCPVCPPPKTCKGPQGQIMKHGDSYKVDCNLCLCWNGAITCTDKICDPCANKVCPPVKCSDSYVPTGECCPVCPTPKDCKLPNGQLIKHGDTFKVDCNTCTCWNGAITCSDKKCGACDYKLCPPVKCSDSYVPTGECCPVCPSPKNCKGPYGQVIKHGDTFKKDCNICTCWNGAITCTDKICDPCANKVCPPVKCSDSYVPPGECCPVCPSPKNCKGPYGQVIKHGDTFKKNCNTCTCWNGAVTCTDKICDPCANKVCPPVKCTDSYVPPGECCPVCPPPKNCKGPSGQIIKHGDSFNVDCNKCTCWNGAITCTDKICDPCANKVCPPVKCSDSYIPPGECCPVCPPPKNCKGPNGQIIKHGDSFKVDCNTCTCWNGAISCTNKICDPCANKVCPPVKCSDSYIPPGECCPVCPPPKNCKGPHGQIIKHGDSFKVDCNKCTCWNGAITCTDKICDPCANKVCPPVKCSDSYIPPGECCPVCPPPKNCKGPNGQTIKHGDSFKVDCNTCTCWNGAVTCTDKICDPCANKVCPPVKCSDSYIPPGECCPVCPPPKNCKGPNGQIIKHGDSFKVDCNTCTCWNGAVTCTDKICDPCANKVCPPVKCSDSYIPPGECCPVCPPPKNCKGPNGQIIKHGDSFKVDCNTCTCWNGAISCTDKICDPCANKVCPPVKCSDSYIPPGECCPVCPPPKNCKGPNGQIIKHGDSFKVDCNKCTCWNGAITCTDKICDPCANKVCPPVKCSDSYIPPGECCPVCPPPKNCKGPNGQIIKHGDSFKVDCNTCTCWNGAISCTDKICDPCANKVCPPVKCSDSYVPPGECCPVCPPPKNCKGPNGQIIKHGDSFKVDCNTCTCWNGAITCTDKICDPCAYKVCQPVKCSDSYIPVGECCPVCPPPKNCMGPNGQIIKHGDSFKVDCNTCTCWNGAISCTDKICDPCANKVCPPVKCSDSYIPPGECCPVCPPPKNCKGPNGQIIKHGDSFNKDCNKCTCWNGVISCTDKICDPCANTVCYPVKCYDSYTPPGECCPVCPPPKNCKGPNGQIIKHGDSFNKDCNKCTCWNGVISCTEKICDPCANKLCPPVKCSDSYVPPGECCPVCPPPKNCKDQYGQVVKHGDSFKKDCNTCTCWNGVISCTDKICDPCANKVCAMVKCSDAYIPPGECCPVCPPPKNCKGPNGQVIKHGDTFKKDCNLCTCWNGVVSCDDQVCDPCAKTVCPLVKCVNSYMPPGSCCPICAAPKNCKAPNGHVIKHGDSYGEDCNKCNCWNGDLSCTNKICDPCANATCPLVGCPDAYIPAGKCCAVCPDPCANTYCPPVNCKHAYVPSGECCSVCSDPCATTYCAPVNCKDSYVPAGECCSVCPDPCANTYCPPVNCKDSYVPAGECCSVCPDPCAYAYCPFVVCPGAYRPPGSCCDICPALPAKCAKVKCLPAPCRNPYIPKGKCCPQCPKNAPKVGRCHSVRCPPTPCSNPYTREGKCCPECPPTTTPAPHDPCHAVKCPPVNCSSPTVPTGKCCAVCPPAPSSAVCVVNGVTYKSGTEVPSADPCNVCACVDGNVVCASMTCAATSCNNAYVPPGKCCAECPPPPQVVDISYTDLFPKSCVVNGFPYGDGDSVPSDETCKSCECLHGNVVCQTKHCSPTNCDDSYTPAGDCCPKCPDH